MQYTVEEIKEQMLEKRPLPTGMTEFSEWSDRIISGTLLPADPDSQKFALATMLMHLPPTTDHECDGYFIKSLRKSAINQIADAQMRELREKAKARLAKEEEAKKLAEEQPQRDAYAAAYSLEEEKTKGEVTAVTTTEAPSHEDTKVL